MPRKDLVTWIGSVVNSAPFYPATTAYVLVVVGLALLLLLTGH